MLNVTKIEAEIERLLAHTAEDIRKRAIANLQTSALSTSVQQELIGSLDIQKDPNGQEYHVIAQSTEARRAEFGATNEPATPWLRLALLQTIPKLKQNILQILKSEISKKKD